MPWKDEAQVAFGEGERVGGAVELGEGVGGETLEGAAHGGGVVAADEGVGLLDPSTAALAGGIESDVGEDALGGPSARRQAETSIRA